MVYKRDDEQAQVEPNRSVKLDHRNAVADRVEIWKRIGGNITFYLSRSKRFIALG